MLLPCYCLSGQQPPSILEAAEDLKLVLSFDPQCVEARKLMMECENRIRSLQGHGQGSGPEQGPGQGQRLGQMQGQGQRQNQMQGQGHNMQGQGQGPGQGFTQGQRQELGHGQGYSQGQGQGQGYSQGQGQGQRPINEVRRSHHLSLTPTSPYHRSNP